MRQATKCIVSVPRWSRAGWMLAILAMLAAAPRSAAAQALSHPIAHTLFGAVQGSAFSDHVEFLGIPFAAPPVGKLRFAPPALPTPWRGVLQTQQFKSSCPQIPGLVGNIPSLNEDCLYLNVYTPPSVNRLLPVMIWIHGGGYTEGGAATYVASALANQGNIIVVTTQYRLNAFGFLASTALSKAAFGGLSGNYGFEDQQAALAWVLTNILAFGGNPLRVTLAGESAGAGSVTNHLVSPFSFGIAGAIGESSIGIGNAGLFLEPTLAQAEITGDNYVAAVGCGTASDVVACLRSLSVGTLLNASVAFPWGPIVDGVDVPQEPNTAIQNGEFHRVPVLDGTNLTEGQLFALNFDPTLAPVTPIFPFDANGYAFVIAQQFGGTAAPAILGQYPAGNYNTPLDAYTNVLTDSGFSCPTSRATRTISGQHVPVYQYEFNETNAATHLFIYPPITGFTWLDPHAIEIQYVFGGGFAPVDQTLAHFTLAGHMLQYWTQFVKTGNPNQAGQPSWPLFNAAQDDVQGLNDNIAPQFNFRIEHNCAFWDSLN